MKKEEAEQLFNDAGRTAIEQILSETNQPSSWLAARAGVHQGTIDAVLRGSAPFSRGLLIKLAMAVDIDPVELLTTAEDRKNNAMLPSIRALRAS